MSRLDLLLVGPTGNTHVASSLLRAANDLGIAAEAVETSPAYAGPAVVRKLAWHMAGRRPARLENFSRHVLDTALRKKPSTLITLGQAPVRGSALEQLRSRGMRCINFSTDDPFNPALRAPWHLSDLLAYDVVFTPRQANLKELCQLGCRDVRYLRFAFDDHLVGGPREQGDPDAAVDKRVLFVGGADADRVAFFSEFAAHGPPLTLIGGYWDRHPIYDAHILGLRSFNEVARLSTSAAVNICLVRRSNRDGHVMRTFEIAAIGGFMLAEDTEEHRDLLGPDGHCVLYFSSAQDAAQKAHWALAHPQERRTMSIALAKLIRENGHTYRHRLETMLAKIP